MRVHSYRWLLLAPLAAVLFLGTSARSDDPPKSKDKGEQIKELEKKIDDLKGKVAAEKAKAAPGGMPAGASAKHQWRSIGPANMGGRVTSISVYEADPSTYYVATASGGLLKTTNNGTTFEHQFDKETTVSLGDVTVCQTDPNLVWVGTGEANPRNSVSYGDGVYKSTDGGKKWTNMGLKNTFSIGRILIHPKDSNIVYVGALGRLYGPNEERGMFKTTDGGKTWEKVLFVDDKTGVIDAVMDPNNPDTIIAATWERKRDEFDGFFGDPPVPDSYGPIVTHGPGSGLYRTTDGGKTWTKLSDPELKNGLPVANYGRIGLDWSRSKDGLVYAVIDTDKVGTGAPLSFAYMGIQGENADDEGGAKLTEITPDGPADKAGLKADDVVTKVGDTTIKNYQDLTELIRATRPDTKLKVTYLREGKEATAEVTVLERPADAPEAQPRGGRGRGQPPARVIAGFRFGETGDAVITFVTPGGPCEKAGVKAGDKITAVDGKSVAKADDYYEIMGSERQAGEVVKFTLLREGKSIDVNVTLAEEAPPGIQVLMPGFAPDPATRGEGLVKVGTVLKDGPAEKAGVKVGDLIMAVEGEPILGMQSMVVALRTSSREENPRKADDKVKVSLKRGDQVMNLELPLVQMTLPSLRGGPMRGGNAARPYQLGLGGQQPNMQARQGPDGVHTGGVFRSDDGGKTWKRVNSINLRPMYFSKIRIDPVDEKTIYLLGDTPTPINRSTNGGERFANLSTARGVHADGHAIWINPKNRNHLIVGCDGGFYVSYDQGVRWEHLNHLALGQFYHVAADSRRPYKVYGGLQDNGSWGGPSATPNRSYGPVNEDYVFVNGGDGFVCRVNPNDPDEIYYESQGGAMGRRNLRTGERGFMRPPLADGDPPHRFNWNTPFILSNHNPDIFYCASEHVWRSIKKGANLRRISPEITRTKKGSGTALSESPVNSDVVWAGSDDGYVWVTTDGGSTWKNVTDAIMSAGLPGHRWVATLEASREREGRCYVCFDGHRSDDDEPYLFVTEDFGKTWKNISSNLPKFGSTRCLREDMVNRDLLYCGTEFGAWVSANRGDSWTKLGGNLPTVAVHELAQAPNMPEVIAATHGRSLWVIDVSTLRQMKSRATSEPVVLFAPANVIRWRTGVSGESPYSSTDRKFVGRNPERTATIDYVLNKPAKEISLRIVDVNNRPVYTFNRVDRNAGFHRVSWNLSRGAGAAQPAGRGQAGGGGGRGGFGGGMGGGTGPVPNGTYRVVLTVDGTEHSQPITIEADPTAPRGVAIEEAQEETPEKEPGARRIDD